MSNKIENPNKTFKVFADDNFDFMDEDARHLVGTYPSHAEALTACKRIVDTFLLSRQKPGMTAEALYSDYTDFGDDPFIDNEEGYAHFSAWDYAKSRCEEVCARPIAE